MNKARGHRSFAEWFRTSRQAELLVIFGEDLAALSGLVLALIAVLLAVVTGNPLWDALGTIVIGVLLIVVAVFVAVEVKAMLIGQSADPDIARDMQAYLAGRPEVARVFNLITFQLGGDVMVSVKVQMANAQSATHLIEQINTVEASFRERYPQVRWSFFEPDDRD